MDGTVLPQLEDKVDEIRGHLEKAKADGWSLNEADTEHKVIDPLLHALGYGLLDIHKNGHDSVANNFPDYTLLPSTQQKWFLEVKKLNLSLQDKEAMQAISYAVAQGAEWAVLTNGRKWYIYNAHLPKPLPEKRVFQIDDLFADDAALKTLAFLSRSSMLTGGLTQAWTFTQVQSIVKKQLETPNSVVRKRLRHIAAEETGNTVSDLLIEQVLRSFTLAKAAGSESTSIAILPPPVPESNINLPPTLYTLAEIVSDSTLGTGRKPTRLHFTDGSWFDMTTWAEVSITAFSHAGKQYGLPALPFTNRAKGKTYFVNTQPTHSTGQPMKAHKMAQVNETTVYMDTNRSTQELISSLLMLFQEVGAPADFVKVSIK